MAAAFTFQTIIAAAESHAMSLNLFDTVNGHQPASPPGEGLTCAVWAQNIGPAPASSGLNKTTALIVLNVRVYMRAIAEQMDAIDPALLDAVSALFTAYSGSFTLGSAVKQVDLLGGSGVRMNAQAGYLTQDQITYRIMTLTLPMVINDLWNQVA